MDASRIERALGLLRGRLVEWTADERWCEQRWAELAQTVRESLRGALHAVSCVAAESSTRLRPRHANQATRATSA
jgi:hypothetical protein